ncbi:redox-sensing transcriptional repressor Rex [Spirochaetia bacterium]|nr:redox-sensing transcriptional repressor Rex [Spirochaetia bacterium]GHV90758.1 redox-sensing transcriptional repressor Rex [Spirochaetia bacterium]
MEQISPPARERLLYLMRILESAGEESLTSAQIEGLTGWSSNTIRKDISCLGGDVGGNAHSSAHGDTHGHAIGSSSGYAPAALAPAIRKALELDRRRKFCVVGLGRLGSAYLNFQAFELGEFELAAGFDTNVNRVEILASPAPLYPAYKMGEVISRFGIEMALLCVPAEAAPAAAEKLVAAGIRGILNFAPVALKVPPEIAVRNVFVADELRSLAIKMQSSIEILKRSEL